MSAVAPPLIRWHLTKTETLPFHFGFHEKKPLSFEHYTTHRKSLTRLDQHFYLLRQQGDAIIVNQQALEKPQEHKYDKEDKLADELTAGGGQGAIEDQAAYEKELVDQAPTEPEHETLIASAKTMGAENATFDRIDEPLTVAAVDEHLLSPHAMYEGEPTAKQTPKDEEAVAAEAESAAAAESDPFAASSDSTASLPPKDDILSLPAKDETMDLSRGEVVVSSVGVPVVMPVAEPVEPTVIEAVKEQSHPEVVSAEEQEEEERAAAQGALASGSLAPIEQTLLANAHKVMEPAEAETATVKLPVAEPVATASSTTLHAPHPSLDDSQLTAETLAADTDTETETEAGNVAATESETATSTEASAASLDALRQQHEEEAAAAKAESERLESGSMSPEEREATELELMSRTKRLAALHERIIMKQTLDAAGPDVGAIRKSPSLPPTTTSSRIMEIQQLHLAQQAESGVTHTVVEKSAPVARGSRTKELARMHEQKIKEEAEAKKQQDDVFAGKAKVGASSSSSSPTNSGRGKKNNRKR